MLFGLEPKKDLLKSMDIQNVKCVLCKTNKNVFVHKWLSKEYGEKFISMCNPCFRNECYPIIINIIGLKVLKNKENKK